MVRLKDIAERGGVSVMTVSKVMRDAPDISAATKARIRRLADEMGYVPDSAAQSLRTRTTRLFGLIIPAITNPVFGRMTLAIEDFSHEHGYDLFLAHTHNLPEREEACIRKLLSRRVDGLFISPVYRLSPSAPIYEELEKNGTPTVILGQRAPFCSQFASVESDDLPASSAATRHLLELGHRRVAFLAGPGTSLWAQERLEGYRRALREADLTVEDRLIFSAGATIEEGEKAALQLLQECTDVTAVQAANDLAAIGAANILLSQGFKIPHDISVVGFGNFLVSEYFRVPLTTIRQPKFRLGVAAMDAMQKLLKGEQPGTRRLAGQLVIRASSGPPPVK